MAEAPPAGKLTSEQHVRIQQVCKHPARSRYGYGAGTLSVHGPALCSALGGPNTLIDRVQPGVRIHSLFSGFWIFVSCNAYKYTKTNKTLCWRDLCEQWFWTAVNSLYV